MSRTAFSAPELALLRTQPQALIGMGLAIHTPSIVWQGTITAAPTFPSDGTGVGQLAVTTVSGLFSNVRSGMTVRLRVLNNGDGLISQPQYYTYARRAPTATILYIDGLSGGTQLINTSTTFYVYDEFLPWPRRHRYNSGSWYMNFDEAYTNQNENFGPQAVMGPTAIKYKNGSQTFNFDGTRSKAWTPGSSIASYLWTFPDATTSASSAPTWATSTAYPNGAYVHLLVTDSNGDTHTGHRLLFKFDSDNPPKTDFEIVSMEGKWGSGWTAELRSPAMPWGGPAYATPNRHCVLFGKSAYGATEQDIGGNFPDRENVWLDGWITHDAHEGSGDQRMHTYTLATIDELLNNLDAFPYTMDDNAAPATWLEMEDLTLDRFAVHFCKWRSTILDIVDVTLPENTPSSRDKKYMDVPAGTLWFQFQKIYGWLIGGTVSCDSQSGIYAEQDAVVTGSTSITLALAGLQYTSYKTLIREGRGQDYRAGYMLPVSQFVAYGVDYDVPVGSRSPDDPIAHGARREEIAAGIHATQTEINLWAGNTRMISNNRLSAITYPLVGIIRIDPTPQCRVNFNADQIRRIVRYCSIEFDFENGMAYTTIGVDAFMSGTQTGQTITFTTL